MADRAVFVLPVFTQAQGVHLLAQLGTLDQQLRFDLSGVARRGPTNHFRKAFGGFELCQPPIALRRPCGDQIMMTASFDPLQICGIRHAAVDHHGAAGAFAGAPLKRAQHLIERSGVVAIAGEDFVRPGKAVAVEDQAHYYLFAVGALVARVAALGLRIARGQTFEVGRGEIVEQQRVIEVKQRPFAFGQRTFDLFAVGMKLIEIAVKRLVTQPTEVALQELLHRTAADPVGHGVFGPRRDQAVEHHRLGD